MKKVNILLVVSLLMTGTVALNLVPLEAAAEADIKLGFVGILTGPASQNGEACSRGALLAVEEINGNGGIKIPGEAERRKFKLLLADDQANPQGN